MAGAGGTIGIIPHKSRRNGQRGSILRVVGGEAGAEAGQALAGIPLPRGWLLPGNQSEDPEDPSRKEAPPGTASPVTREERLGWFSSW